MRASGHVEHQTLPATSASCGTGPGSGETAGVFHDTVSTRRPPKSLPLSVFRSRHTRQAHRVDMDVAGLNHRSFCSNSRPKSHELAFWRALHSCLARSDLNAHVQPNCRSGTDRQAEERPECRHRGGRGAKNLISRCQRANSARWRIRRVTRMGPDCAPSCTTTTGINTGSALLPAPRNP